MCICLLKYQYRLCPRRTGCFAAHGIYRATACRDGSRPSYTPCRFSFTTRLDIDGDTVKLTPQLNY